MNLACPECSTVYRLDPDRIPGTGTATRCRACGTPFLVEPAPQRPGEVATAARAEAASPRENGSPRGPAREPAREPTPQRERAGAAADPDGGDRPSAPVFGPQDPDTRARRLARALISDITAYNPTKWQESLRSGSLRSDFREEILKSWDEYVEQVGESMAKRTPHFRDALNDILARGGQVF